MRRHSLAVGCSVLMGLIAGCGSDTVKTNHAPTAASASITTAADTPSAPVTPQVSDPDNGDRHTFEIVVQPGRGAAAVVDDRLVYTPDPGFAGQDSFTFRATDSGGLSVDGTAGVTVSPVNHAPLATRGGRPVLATGAGASWRPIVDDPDIFDSAAVQVTMQPAFGAASANGAAWTYTPQTGFTSGSDSFAYQVTDSGGKGISGTGLVRVYDLAALDGCTAAGEVNPDGTLKSLGKANGCALLGEVSTRTSDAGTAVTLKYFVNAPSGATPAKAVVVLIQGGDLSLGPDGDPTSGVAAKSGGGNFLIRTAQLFADRGFLAIAVGQPSDQPPSGSTDTVTDSDRYRISIEHAVDLLGVIREVNTERLPVFLAGTSRGAMSVVANNLIATGISISSPVTSDPNPDHVYVGRPDVPVLLPAYVARPSHVLWHVTDVCTLSTPAGSQTLAQALASGGRSRSDALDGGIRVTTASALATPDGCGPLHYHGFLGIEPRAIGVISDWLDARLAELGGNHPPEVASVTVPAHDGATRRIDLSTLVRDADGDVLSYAVLHGTTRRGTPVGIDGAIATYTAPAGPATTTDDFVFVVTDGRGGVGAGVVTLRSSP